MNTLKKTLMLALVAASMLAGSGSHAQELWKESHALKFGNSKGNGLLSTGGGNGLYANEKGNGRLSGVNIDGLTSGSQKKDALYQLKGGVIGNGLTKEREGGGYLPDFGNKGNGLYQLDGGGVGSGYSGGKGNGLATSSGGDGAGI